MTDIVERLRAETNNGGLLRWCDPSVANAAADEIGRLRAIIRINALRQGATHKEVDAVLYPVAQHD